MTFNQITIHQNGKEIALYRNATLTVHEGLKQKTFGSVCNDFGRMELENIRLKTCNAGKMVFAACDLAGGEVRITTQI